MLTTLERHVQRVTRILALGAAACLLGVALLTMADVLLRWLFKMPIKGIMDVTALASAVILAAMFPALLAQRGNVTIRLLGSFAGPKAARLLDSFGALVTVIFFALMTWKYIEYSAEMTSANESTVILRWLTGPWWWVVTAMIGMTTLVGVVVFARDIAGRDKDAAGAS
jgi:TRAP-type C4-dicarboxylate transport system permease small subunit